MTLEIAIVYLLLGAALVLFVTEWLRFDVVALLVLGTLAIAGLVTTEEAFSGFSNPAVVTVWAMFIISEGLSKTGIAGWLGRYVIRLAGQGEARLVSVVTGLAAGMSAFMNNIGVAALLLPVTMDICRTTGISPSRLLMPMAYGTLLGGLTTMIGTPPNLLVTALMSQSGFQPFALFDFARVGIPILIAGILFFRYAGRHLLPTKAPAIESERLMAKDLRWRYGLDERTFLLRVPEESRLVGQSIGQSRLARSAGLKVIATVMDGQASLLPSLETEMQAGQQLMVQGRRDRLERLREWSGLTFVDESVELELMVSQEVLLFEVRIAEGAGVIGTTPDTAVFREQFRGNLLAIRRNDQFATEGLSDIELKAGDRLLVQGGKECLDLLEKSPNYDECFEVDESLLRVAYDLPRQIFVMTLPDDSGLAGETLEESGLADLFDFSLLGLSRDGQLTIVPNPDTVLEAGDHLVFRGTEAQMDQFRSLQEFVVLSSTAPDLGVLESEKVALIEATVKPRSSLVGETIGEIDFEERYDLELLAIWRHGRAYRTDLLPMTLNVGDSLLLLGPRDRLRQFEEQPDFVTLTPLSHETEQTEKAPFAAIILAAVLVSVLSGWLPIAVAAVVGAALMVALNCLSMEDAYRAIEWRSIFLIAGMLPLGIALESTGGAAFIATTVMDLMSGAGPYAVIMAFYALTALATLFVPTAALVVLMGPIVISASQDFGIHPQTGMMAIAIAASASFASPVSHPANLLIMGPGGYRFSDYLKLGLPLSLLVGLVTAALLPLIWPITSV